MSTSNYGNSGGDQQRRGGYQQKRGGGAQTHGGGHGRGGYRPSDNQQPKDNNQNAQQSSKYVKKTNTQKEMSQQELIDQLNMQAEEQFRDESGLTVDQKFQMMLSGQLPDIEESKQGEQSNQAQGKPEQQIQAESQVQVENQQQILRNPNRRRFTREQLLLKFEKESEISLKHFDKDLLDWVEILSSGPLLPESDDPQEQAAEGVLIQNQPKRRAQTDRYQKPGQPQWRGGPGGKMALGSLEEEEDEQDPEWIDFDPKKESNSFFGRAIVNETELRENVKKEKERQQKIWGSRKTQYQIQEEEFERLTQIEKDSAAKKVALIDKDIEQQVEVLATDIEKNERNFSDIDMIYEKNMKQKRQQQQQALDDDQLDELFNQLMNEEDKKTKTKQVSSSVSYQQEQNYNAPQQNQAQMQQQQQQQQVQRVDLPQDLQQQIKNLSIQQKQQLQQQKIVSQVRPKFTALQNIQNLFQNLPVVTHDKHRIKMQEIADMEEEKEQGELFKQLTQSINPFSKYILEENIQQGKTSDIQPNGKHWTLEESIFQKPADQLRNDHYQKTSSEMFKIYKFLSDPFMKVKSNVYTENKFVQIKDLFPTKNLLETSPLNLQIQLTPPRQMMMNPMNVQLAQMQGAPMNMQNAIEFIPQRKLSAQQELQPNESQQIQIQPKPQTSQQQQQQQQPEQRTLQRADQFMQNQAPQYEELGGYDDEGENNEIDELQSMESQLKSLLGFNPK
ncbi:UNKNOWN [Stylonychia lemnae]|uniref:Uncharacterized protein n=1 Tax=Stylonychia lemnae TaxID=5949 RepID=A0A078AK38_STYLE|nr:UNKNOWN [Stylonychia lemnae]|eukprot:CDW82539.1 UNKNOWN [Stylonychia lemnae]